MSKSDFNLDSAEGEFRALVAGAMLSKSSIERRDECNKIACQIIKQKDKLCSAYYESGKERGIDDARERGWGWVEAVEVVSDPLSVDSTLIQIQRVASKLFWHFYLVRRVKFGNEQVECVWSPELTKQISAMRKAYVNWSKDRLY